MYAVIITAKTTMTTAEIPGRAVDMARALLETGAHDGLVCKTFLHNGSTIGGFHLFADRSAAERFLDGPFWQRASASPWISDIDVRHYHVADEASVLNGTPTEPMSATVRARARG